VASAAPAADPAAVYLQVGAFGEAAAAEQLAARLRREELAPVSVQAPGASDRPLHRVRVGPLPAGRVDAVIARLTALGLPSLRLPAP
jgi:rare lipoprotein A